MIEYYKKKFIIFKNYFLIYKFFLRTIEYFYKNYTMIANIDVNWSISYNIIRVLLCVMYMYKKYI